MMRASWTMTLAAGPLALWGAWALWVSLPGAHWMTAAFGGAALLTAGGLLRLQGWAKFLAYLFAAALALGWIYAVWQVARRGWPYPDWLGTVLSLIPGVLLLSLCAGGAWVVHQQYRRRDNESEQAVRAARHERTAPEAIRVGRPLNAFAFGGNQLNDPQDPIPIERRLAAGPGDAHHSVRRSPTNRWQRLRVFVIALVGILVLCGVVGVGVLVTGTWRGQQQFGRAQKAKADVRVIAFAIQVYVSHCGGLPSAGISEGQCPVMAVAAPGPLPLPSALLRVHQNLEGRTAGPFLSEFPSPPSSWRYAYYPRADGSFVVCGSGEGRTAHSLDAATCP